MSNHSRILRIAVLSAAIAVTLPAWATGASARDATSDLTAGVPLAGPTDTIPVLIAAPVTGRFPGRAIGTTSPSRTMTFTNSTPDPTTVASVILSGDDPAAFAITAETCTSAPVAPGGTCTVDLAFTPGVLDELSAVVQARDVTAAELGAGTVVGIGQAASHVAWGTTYGAGSARTWSYGGALARTATTTTSGYLHSVYLTDRVGGRTVTDTGPYQGVSYVRSASAMGSTWSTPVRLNPSTQHGDQAVVAAAGSTVYAVWLSERRVVRYSPTAPRAVWVRVNTSNGAGTWRSPLRLTSATGRAYAPAVAAAGSRAYIAYTDSNTGDVHVLITTNRGLTWRNVRLGSTSRKGTNGYAGFPTVAATGSTVIVAWAATDAIQIRSRISTNGGSTWGGSQVLTSAATYSPDATAIAGRLAVAWGTADGAAVRVRSGGVWGPAREVGLPDDGTPYASIAQPTVVLNGTSRIGLSWVGCNAGCDASNVLWAESADNGASWYATQVAVASSSTNVRKINDAPSIAWPSTGRRTLLWNGYTPGTTNSRMYVRTAAGTP